MADQTIQRNIQIVLEENASAGLAEIARSWADVQERIDSVQGSVNSLEERLAQFQEVGGRLVDSAGKIAGANERFAGQVYTQISERLASEQAVVAKLEAARAAYEAAAPGGGKGLLLAASDLLPGWDALNEKIRLTEEEIAAVDRRMAELGANSAGRTVDTANRSRYVAQSYVDDLQAQETALRERIASFQDEQAILARETASRISTLYPAPAPPPPLPAAPAPGAAAAPVSAAAAAQADALSEAQRKVLASTEAGTAALAAQRAVMESLDASEQALASSELRLSRTQEDHDATMARLAARAATYRAALEAAAAAGNSTASAEAGLARVAEQEEAADLKLTRAKENYVLALERADAARKAAAATPPPEPPAPALAPYQAGAFYTPAGEQIDSVERYARSWEQATAVVGQFQTRLAELGATEDTARARIQEQISLWSAYVATLAPASAAQERVAASQQSLASASQTLPPWLQAAAAALEAEGRAAAAAAEEVDVLRNRVEFLRAVTAAGASSGYGAPELIALRAELAAAEAQLGLPLTSAAIDPKLAQKAVFEQQAVRDAAIAALNAEAEAAERLAVRESAARDKATAAAIASSEKKLASSLREAEQEAVAAERSAEQQIAAAQRASEIANSLAARAARIPTGSPQAAAAQAGAAGAAGIAQDFSTQAAASVGAFNDAVERLVNTAQANLDTLRTREIQAAQDVADAWSRSVQARLALNQALTEASAAQAGSREEIETREAALVAQAAANAAEREVASAKAALAQISEAVARSTQQEVDARARAQQLEADLRAQEVQISLRAFQQQVAAAQQAASQEETAQGGLFERWAGHLQNLVVNQAFYAALGAVQMGFSKIGEAIHGMVQEAGAAETEIAQWTILSGSAAVATQRFQEIVAQGVKVPIPLKDLEAMDARLQEMGVSQNSAVKRFGMSLDDVRKGIETIALLPGMDMSKALEYFTRAGDGANRLALSLRSAGIIQEDELQKFGVRFNAAGTTILSDADTTTSALLNLVQSKFGGLVDQVGNTWDGLQVKVQNAWEKIGITVGKPLETHIEAGMQKFLDWLDDPATSTNLDKIGVAVDGLATKIMDLVGSVTALGDKLGVFDLKSKQSGTLGGLLDFMGNAIGGNMDIAGLKVPLPGALAVSAVTDISATGTAQDKGSIIEEIPAITEAAGALRAYNEIVNQHHDILSSLAEVLPWQAEATAWQRVTGSVQSNTAAVSDNTAAMERNAAAMAGRTKDDTYAATFSQLADGMSSADEKAQKLQITLADLKEQLDRTKDASQQLKDTESGLLAPLQAQLAGVTATETERLAGYDQALKARQQTMTDLQRQASASDQAFQDRVAPLQDALSGLSDKAAAVRDAYQAQIAPLQEQATQLDRIYEKQQALQRLNDIASKIAWDKALSMNIYSSEGRAAATRLPGEEQQQTQEVGAQEHTAAKNALEDRVKALQAAQAVDEKAIASEQRLLQDRIKVIEREHTASQRDYKEREAAVQGEIDKITAARDQEKAYLDQQKADIQDQITKIKAVYDPLIKKAEDLAAHIDRSMADLSAGLDKSVTVTATNADKMLSDISLSVDKIMAAAGDTKALALDYARAIAPLLGFIAELQGLQQRGGAAAPPAPGQHAAGGKAEGWSWVGEGGPELAYFGQPAEIYPAWALPGQGNGEQAMAARGMTTSKLEGHIEIVGLDSVGNVRFRELVESNAGYINKRIAATMGGGY